VWCGRVVVLTAATPWPLVCVASLWSSSPEAGAAAVSRHAAQPSRPGAGGGRALPRLAAAGRAAAVADPPAGIQFCSMDAFLLRLLYLDLRFIYDGANPCHLFGRYPGDLAPELGSAVRYGNSTHKSFSRSCKTIRVRIPTKRSSVALFLARFISLSLQQISYLSSHLSRFLTNTIQYPMSILSFHLV
jgi:hypothetical protein